jgi:hypothetical protein
MKEKDGGRFVVILAQLKTKAVSRETFSNCRALLITSIPHRMEISDIFLLYNFEFPLIMILNIIKDYFSLSTIEYFYASMS